MSDPVRMFGNTDAIAGAVVPTERVDCPVCGIEPERFATDYQGFNLCRCPKCRLEFVNPRLSYEQLADNVYSHNYFPDEGEEMVVPPDRAHYFQRQLDDFGQLKPQKGRLLDLGCGNCEFLDAARADGWEVAGIDIILTPRARRYDAPIFEGRLENIDLSGEQFDIIRLNHVLEHMQDPVASLELLRGALRPGGLIFVSVPNIAGISTLFKNLQSRFGLKSKKWRHYAAVHHLFFFNSDTLGSVMQKAGYKVLRTSTPQPIRPGQGKVSYQLALLAKEKTGLSSILDVYATPE